MKKYLASILVLSLVLLVAAFSVLWLSPDNFTNAFPMLVAYFLVLTIVQHIFITRSTKKDLRTFVRNSFGVTVGGLVLHFLILVIYMFSHIHQAHANKIFAIGFLVGYVCYLVFEVIALLMYIRRHNNSPAPDTTPTEQ